MRKLKGDRILLTTQLLKDERGVFGRTEFSVIEDVQRLLDDHLVGILQRGYAARSWSFFQL